jgi:hypothetical protein
MSRTWAGAAVLVLLVAAGAIGYLIGTNGAPDDADARLAQTLSFHRALPRAERSALLAARLSGFVVGLATGRRHGERAGERRGARAGERAAGAEEKRLAEEREAAEREAAEQAEREAAEQAEVEASEERTCNVPLFIDGYCPTQAEIEQENQAEGEAGIGD